ncbi:MAG: LptE family protein [Planctomycetota bacterium]|nr:LptE family protein [Planctomycetota bacterium]
MKPRRPRFPVSLLAVSLFPVSLLALSLLSVSVLAPVGCAADPRQGYSFASTYPDGIESVRVPVFENYTYEPGLDAEVTEAIIKELQRSSSLRVVQGDAAASVLKGVITGVDLRRLSLDRQTGFAQELAVTITVDFEWRDARSGKVLAARSNFRATDTFVPARPTAERFDTGRHAAVSRLARDIASELRSGW